MRKYMYSFTLTTTADFCWLVLDAYNVDDALRAANEYVQRDPDAMCVLLEGSDDPRIRITNSNIERL